MLGYLSEYSIESLVVLVIEISKSNHLGAQGTFSPGRSTAAVGSKAKDCARNAPSIAPGSPLSR